MMEFKEIINEDREIFLNFSEFAETHRLRIQSRDFLITGVISAWIREKTINERSRGRGLYVAVTRLYIKDDIQIIKQLHQGMTIQVDDYRYTITSIEDQSGIIRLELEGYHQ